MQDILVQLFKLFLSSLPPWFGAREIAFAHPLFFYVLNPFFVSLKAKFSKKDTK